MKKRFCRFFILVCLLTMFVPSASFAESSGDWPSPPIMGYEAISVMDYAKTQIESEVQRAKNALVRETSKEDSTAVASSQMALDWIATRTVFFGITDIDATAQMLADTEGVRKTMLEVIATRGAVSILLNHTAKVDGEEKTISEQTKEILDSWDRENIKYLTDRLTPLFEKVFGEGYMDGSASGYNAKTFEAIQSVQAAFERQDTMRKIVEKLKGVEGLDSASGSLFRRLLVVGQGIIVFALIVRLGVMMYSYFMGKRDESGPKEIFRFATYFILMLCVPYIVLGGMAFVDSLRNMILGDNPAEQYELMSATLKLRAQYAGAEDGSLTSMTLANGVAIVASLLARAVVYILLIMCDVMMAITAMAAPLVIPLSLLPTFSDYLTKWLKAVVTFLFYPIAAAVYTVLMIAIVVANMETSSITLIIISVCYLLGSLKIPSIAEQMNGAVLASVATTMAMAPMKAGGAALGAAANMGGGGIGKAVGAALGRGSSGPAT